MSGVIETPASTARLDAAWRAAPPHLRPVIEAVRDAQIGLLFVAPDAGRFAIPTVKAARPGIVILGDDFAISRGPAAFHRASLRKVAKASSVIAVVSCEPLPELYASVATSVVSGNGNALIVETQLSHEFQWIETLQRLAPGKRLVVATVRGGSA